LPGMVCPAGFKPTTVRLEGECSIQLSYGHINHDHRRAYRGLAGTRSEIESKTSPRQKP